MNTQTLTPEITPEIIRCCNPGVSDFGLGRLMALTSHCLRTAKKPTTCDICLKVCPVHALDGEMSARPHPTTSCLKCGVCVSACPVNALAGSARTIQQINRLILQAALRVERLAITCERTSALLRLELETVEPEHAEQDLEVEVIEPELDLETTGPAHAEQELELIDQAVASEHLSIIPCLGMLGPEIWFSALNEIGVARLSELLVYLPPEQCTACPVNALGTIEETFSTAIATAERWTGQQVGLIMEARELPQARKADVRAYLTGEVRVDRRGMFTGFMDELKASWDESARTGNRALDETRRQRVRSLGFERTKLWAANKAAEKDVPSPMTTPVRYMLVESLGRNPEHADDVVLTVSTIDPKRCTRCGTCVDACPVHARHFVNIQPEAESEAGASAAAEAEALKDAATITAAATIAAATEKAPEPQRRIVVETLYCMACSACMQACPAQACGYTEISGVEFLLD
ncbi:MAG: 4Fe-4S binding protein [Coriobacteriales bacterium]|jgi:ferredoxin|nr:4Fe-4S binding protein [Coriobacteriales bacterium]